MSDQLHIRLHTEKDREVQRWCRFFFQVSKLVHYTLNRVVLLLPPYPKC
jgi:hypothetical protein